MDSIPTPSRIVELANTPSDPREPFRELNQYDVYRTIHEYYSRFTDIDAATFQIVSKETEDIIDKRDSILYTSDGFQLSNYKDMRSNYSNYNQEAIERAGLNIDEIWNGQSCVCVYEDESLKFGETDYYTSTIFTRLLYVEAAKMAASSGEISASDFGLRNRMLRTEEQIFDTPAFCTGASSGGLLFGKSGGEWCMLLARRSDKPRVNQGLVSIAPNGGVEYSDYQSNETFKNTLRREFSEELFSSQKEGLEFFDKNVEAQQSSIGWNLRSGQIAVGHSMYVDEGMFEVVENVDETNFEFSELIKIPVNDLEEILDVVNFQNFSPSVIPVVMRSLKRFDEKDNTPDLPYKIVEN